MESVFQDPLQKTACGFMTGLVEKIPRRGAFGNPAVSNKCDKVSGVACESHFVGDEDDWFFGAAQFGDDIQNLGGHLGIERRGRLIEEQKSGIDRKSAGDGNALALAAAELGGLLGGVVEQLEASEELVRT